MSAASRRAVIFDIGRVLVRVDVGRAMQKLTRKIKLTPEETWSAIEKDPRWHDWQEGRIAPVDWHQHLERRLGCSLSFAEFCEAWNAALDPEPIQDNGLLETVAKQCKVGLLSNTDPIHVAHLEATYSFFRYFPPKVRTYSCRVGASKPSPVIFRAALKCVGAVPAETAFIDDVANYVEAARKLGMTGIDYQSREQLLNDLRVFGALD